MIVVLWYNKVSETCACVEAILRCGVRAQDILLWDNGSLPEHADSVRGRFPACRHGRSESNRGFAGGCNDALREARGYPWDLVLFLTNDTRLIAINPAKTLELQQHFGAGFLAPLIVYERSPSRIDSFGGWFDSDTAQLFHHRTESLPPLLDQTEYIPGTAFWVQQEKFCALNGLDERYFTYWEDVDLAFRAHAQNIPLIRDPFTRIAHRVGRTCHKHPLYTAYYYQRNRKVFVDRFFPGTEGELSRQAIHSDLTKMYEKALQTNDNERLGYLKQLGIP